MIRMNGYVKNVQEFIDNHEKNMQELREKNRIYYIPKEHSAILSGTTDCVSLDRTCFLFGNMQTIDAESCIILDTSLVKDLNPKDRSMLFKWLSWHLVSQETPNVNYNSNYLKVMFENDTNIHLTENQFKNAMLICGFEPTNPKKWLWTFKISKRHLKKASIEWGRK